MACGHTEVRRFKCQFEAFYKGRNNAEPIDPKEANYSRAMDRYPVAVGSSCPTKAQLKVLGLSDKSEVRSLQQRWRHAQGKIESIDWLETFKKTAPYHSASWGYVKEQAFLAHDSKNTYLAVVA